MIAALTAAERESLYALLARFGLQGPPSDMDTLAAIVGAAGAPGAVTVTFAEAEAVGGELHDRWETMTGTAPLDREDMAWGDVVQFVLRKARDQVALREVGDGR